MGAKTEMPKYTPLKSLRLMKSALHLINRVFGKYPISK